jgi:hypothetical protein
LAFVMQPLKLTASPARRWRRRRSAERAADEGTRASNAQMAGDQIRIG